MRPPNIAESLDEELQQLLDQDEDCLYYSKPPDEQQVSALPDTVSSVPMGFLVQQPNGMVYDTINDVEMQLDLTPERINRHNSYLDRLFTTMFDNMSIGDSAPVYVSDDGSVRLFNGTRLFDSINDLTRNGHKYRKTKTIDLQLIELMRIA